MWFIQTPVDSLALPIDGAGRVALTGTVGAWYHAVRDHAFAEEDRIAVANMSVRWTICAWEQAGRRVEFHATIPQHAAIAEAIRANQYRPCAFARYPQAGKRQSDNVIDLIIVMPQEQFSRYEPIVHFAMTLPSGHVSLTLPSPVVAHTENDVLSSTRLISPGTYALMDRLEIVVARSGAVQLDTTEARHERRRVQDSQDSSATPDDGDDWLLFAAQPSSAHGNAVEPLSVE